MAKRDNLESPRGTPGGPVYDSDAFARFAERIARFLGTGRYLAGQTIFVILWIFLNVVGLVSRWDPYPFILLNLAFSTQAAYAAPLILLAQNRQADRDKDEIERDRAVNARSLAETEFLAREIAAVRILLEQKADRDDIHEPIERLIHTLERAHGLDLRDVEDGDPAAQRQPRAGELEEPAGR
ncbi:MAG TPA: DUF1003 domain-containing protein [Solirubrobacteraceae bacterium]|jgi:uncharacterized membrane protein|nr:DUF1003 domain-containing protein [Solirubrobacteraceae bacterium]